MGGSRRELLASAVGLWVLGLDGLAVAGPMAATSLPALPVPDGLLARMAAQDKDAVVFLAPDDEPGRKALGAAIEALFQATEGGKLGPPPDLEMAPTVHTLVTLQEVVYAVSSPSSVGAQRGEQVVLLGRDGRRLAGGSLDSTSPKTMVRSLRALLDREPFASARRERPPAKQVRAFRERLDDPAGYPWVADTTRARAAFSRLVPAFVEEAMLPDGGELQYRLQSAMAQALAGVYEKEGGPPSVFGVTWAFESYDSCPMCGLSSFPSYSRTFVDFVASDD